MPRDAKNAPSQFGAASAQPVLDEACRLAHLDASDAKLIRLGENALFHLPSAASVVRIARSMAYWVDAEKEVCVAGWLKECGLAAVEVYQTDQPLEVLSHPVTFWKYIDGRPGGREDIATLGTVLAELHALARPRSFHLADENILGRVDGRIKISNIPEADKDFLRTRASELQSQVDQLRFPLPAAPTHGDAHSENLMIRKGLPVLIDLERFAWGHPEWDLSMTATEYASAGWWTDSEYRAFAAAYGYDVMDWDGFPILQAVHEVKMTTWLMQNVGESEDIADEYHVRMDCLRTGRSSRWQPF